MADDWGEDLPTTTAPEPSWGAAPAASSSFTSPAAGNGSFSRGGGSSWGKRGGSSWGAGAAASGDGGDDGERHAPKTRVSVPAQIEVSKLSVDTTVLDLKHAFGRFGRLQRVVLDCRLDENRAFAWIDYENEASIDKALLHVKQIRTRDIEIQRCLTVAGEGGGRGRGRGRGRGGSSDSGGWGSSMANTDSSSWTSNTDSSDWGNSSTSNDWGNTSSDRAGRGRGGGRGGFRGNDRSRPYDRNNRSSSSWGNNGNSDTSASGADSWDTTPVKQQDAKATSALDEGWD